MSKKDDFIRLVQTAAIVESLSQGEEENNFPKASITATIAVDCAMKVNENDISEDLAEACKKLIDYVFHNTIPKPSWLTGIL